MDTPHTCRTCKHARQATLINGNDDTERIEGWGICRTIKVILQGVEYLQENKETLKKTAYIVHEGDSVTNSDLVVKLDEFGCLLHTLKS